MATSTGGLVGQYLGEASRIEQIRRQRKKFRNVEAFPFWPHEAVRSVIIVLAFSAATLYVSALMPYFLESPANPAGQPEVILPDWYLLWSYGLLKPGVANPITLGGETIQVPVLQQIDPTHGALTAKQVGILLNIIITIPLVLMPFISTGHPRRPQEAPWTAAFGVAGIVYVFNVSVYSVNNVVFTKYAWWGDSLAKIPFALTQPGVMEFVALAFWVLPLPIASFLIRWKWLKEGPRFAGLVSIVSIVLLMTVVGYGAGLDLARLVQDPMRFWFESLKGTNLLAWIVWWSTLLSFEVSYWALLGWKQHSVRQDTYEHGLNLTYYKVR